MTNPICIISNNTMLPSPLVEVEFKIIDKTFKIYFRTDGDTALTGNIEAFLACALLPSMKMGGGEIRINGEISSKFLSALDTIQDIYCTWQPSFKRTNITGITAIQRTQTAEHKRVGAFFTGGVDSL
jgi:hypothetical protein